MIETEKPPVFKSWNHWYILLLLVLLLFVLVLSWLTQNFS